MAENERRAQVGEVRNDDDGRIREVAVDRHILDPNDPKAVQIPEAADGTRLSPLDALSEDAPENIDNSEEDAARGRKYVDNTLNPQRAPGLKASDDVPGSKRSTRKSDDS